MRRATKSSGASRRARSLLRRRRGRRRGIGRLFFDRGESLLQPHLLLLLVGARQPLAWPLHGEAEFVEHPRHVVIVIADAESPPNQLADPRPCPDPARKATGHWPGLDDRHQPVLLIR